MSATFPLARVPAALSAATGQSPKLPGWRTAMAAVAAGVVLGVTVPAIGQGALSESTESSKLDAPLFYQLLIGEMQAREGDAGAAYEIMLDAAKRSRDEQLFRRATDLALEGRVGDQALAAAKAWRTAFPQSLEAHRYVVQILIALGRSSEAIEPMQSLVSNTPLPQRVNTIESLPRFYNRSPDAKQAGSLLEQVLAPQLAKDAAAPLKAAAGVAIGRGWLAADDRAKALESAQRAHAADAVADGPALLALELMPASPTAETVVQDYLKAKPVAVPVRLLYARQLAALQRYPDAVTQLEQITQTDPKLAAPWLSLGALHLELRHTAEAEAALQRYVSLVQDADAGTAAAEPADDDAAPALTAETDLTQAWLLLSVAAEQKGDVAAAEAWLAKVDDPKRAVEVQSRRASLLARQGKIDEARALVRSLPEGNADEARAKLLAESQILREAKRWSEAYTVLGRAAELFPEDADILYEQSMMAERMDHVDDMERLLRKVIALRPDYHQAYNALGFSLAERNMRLPEARTLISKALALMPDEPFITDSMGWVEYRLGNREEALRLLKQAYKARPDTEIGAHLGEVLWVAGQKEEARRIWRESRNRDQGNDVLRATLSRLRVEL